MKRNKLKDFEIREYKIKDFPKIRELFNISFGRDLSYEYWKWKCIENPMGKSTAFLMFDGDKLIGHYNVDASILNFRDKNIKAVLSCDTMTHPDYHGLGIFPHLAKLTYQKVMENDVLLVYGFPNINSHKIFEEKLGWVKFSNLPFIFKDLTKYNKKKIKNQYLITNIEKFGNEIDNFYEEIKKSPLILRKISKDILNWRYNKNSTKKYDKFLIRNKKNRELLAFFVSKIYNDKFNESSIDLVDFFIKSQNSKQEYNIINAIQDFLINYYNHENSKIMIWMPNKEILKYLFQELKYQYVNVETFFGFRFLKKKIYYDHFRKISNWYLTMAHSDVF